MGDNTKTVYITMIRDPVDIFVSAWDYYKLNGNYKMTIGRNHGQGQTETGLFLDHRKEIEVS